MENREFYIKELTIDTQYIRGNKKTLEELLYEAKYWAFSAFEVRLKNDGYLQHLAEKYEGRSDAYLNACGYFRKQAIIESWYKQFEQLRQKAEGRR